MTPNTQNYGNATYDDLGRAAMHIAHTHTVPI